MRLMAQGEAAGGPVPVVSLGLTLMMIGVVLVLELVFILVGNYVF